VKKIYFILIVLAFNVITFAQSTQDVGKIALSVVMPENIEGLDISHLSKLESKISQIVTMSGLAGSGINNNFVIYPKFLIYESNIVEGGMQNITVITAELNLFIKQVDNNILFSSINKQLKGNGSSKALAITNAISKISTNDPEFNSFIEKAKTKIIEYYNVRCGDIIKKSESYVKMQKYDQALGLLMTVPEEVSSCYNQIQEKAIEAYKAYKTQECSELIQKAKTSLAGNDYKGTLTVLSEIDPSTSCFKEAQNIAKSVQSKIQAEEKKQWDFKMKKYNDAVMLKKLRIEAIKEIAVAYYKNQPKNINYNYIIK
jgi:predicted amino acid racemase